MSRLFATALAVGLFIFGAPPHPLCAQSTTRDTSLARPDTASDPMSAMARPLDIPHNRSGSGTSWLPDATATREYQHTAGRWMLMAHGVVDLYYDHQGSARGANQVGSTNWVMGMAMRQLGGGMLQLNAMMSAEPFTVGSAGYPLLLQSGETNHGQPLHDRQHPHDLFMELAATYEHQFSDKWAISLYAAPVGEPALGPVAFMHRPSAQSDILAPIAHHWQDATHISFGVATVGIYTHAVKLEGSIFNGREPDENRYDFDFRPFDSWSGRVSVNPAPAWSLNASYGFLKSPEGLHPDEAIHRAGASIMRTSTLGESGELASALIYGGNHPTVAGVTGVWQHSLVAETNAQLDDRNTVFGRLTWVQKTADELVVATSPADEQFNITSVSLGYARVLAHFSHTAFSIGARGAIGFVPSALEPTYGTRHPAGIAVFVRLRPMASTHSMAGMDMAMPMATGRATHPTAEVLQ